MTRSIFFAAWMVLGGCSSDGIGSGSDGSAPRDGGSQLADQAMAAGDLPMALRGDMASTTTLTVSIGPIDLASGQEATKCTVFKLPSAVDIDVTRINSTLAPGSHHLILYTTQDAEQTTPYDCAPLDVANNKNVPLYIAETQAMNDLALPTGVAYHLPGGQMMKLEAHYLNATAKAIQGRGDVTLTVGAPANYQKADIMFCGSVTPLYKGLGGSGVPPGKSTLPPGFYVPPTGTKVFGLTTHEHKRGSLMTINKSTGAADPGTNLVMGAPYDNPPFVTYDDAHLVTFGTGEGLRWQCSYDNPTQNTYVFGESAENNEMCFLWGYYFPSVGHFISQECIR